MHSPILKEILKKYSHTNIISRQSCILAAHLFKVVRNLTIIFHLTTFISDAHRVCIDRFVSFISIFRYDYVSMILQLIKIDPKCKLCMRSLSFKHFYHFISRRYRTSTFTLAYHFIDGHH